MSVANIYRTNAFGPAIPPRITSGGFALFANGTGTASFDSFRVTQYPDPSVSLVNAGRAINSLCNWNGNFPTNTNVAVSTSIDNGVTWQPHANPGDYISSISTAAHYTAVRAVSGLQAFYRLNELSGANGYDSSNNGNTAAFHGGVTLGQAGALQGINESGDTSVLLDGSTGYISLPTALNGNGYTALSIGAWFNLSTGSLGSFSNLISAGTSAAKTGYLIYWSSTTSLNVVVGNGTTTGQASYATTATAGVWVHVVGTFDGSNVKIYVNGVLRATTALTGTISASQTPIIGASTGLSTFFPGKVAGVFITNTDIGQAGVTSIYNAGINATQATYNDSFTTNTSANYTQTFGTGGIGATSWTWDTTNSRIVAVGGTRALLVYNTFTASDVDMLSDWLQSENGGIIWHYTNASNYYELVIKDSTNGNTFTLNKMSGGTLTTLTSAAISFTTGTHHRCHVTMFGGVITAFLDENQILTYTDGSPLANGQWGLRNDTGTSYCYLLQATPQAPNISNLFLCVKQQLSTTDATVTPQITDLQAMVSGPTFWPGTLIPTATYNSANSFVSSNTEDLKNQSDYFWSMSDEADSNGNYHVSFQPREATPAPWPLDENNYQMIAGQQINDILLAGIGQVYGADLYRNRMVIKNAIATSAYDQIFIGDGKATSWTLTNPIVAAPTSWTLNGLSVSFGLQGVDTGKQFYYQIGSTSITADSGQTVLTVNDNLEIKYSGSSVVDVTRDNLSIPGTITQSALAAITGDSGIVTAAVDVSGQNMSVAAAETYGDQMLARYGVIGVTFNFTTLRSGLHEGQQLMLYTPHFNLNKVLTLVTDVRLSQQVAPGVNGGVLWAWQVTAQTGPALGSWVKMLSLGLNN